MASTHGFGCARSCQAGIISGGGVSATIPVVCRGVCIRNVGNSPIRFSRIGFYKATADAHDGRTCDVICENKATIRLYTIGITPVRGSAITFDPVLDYNDISKAHHVTLVPNAALVIDFGLDVSFSVVRFGKVDSFTDPSACRLEMKTGSGYHSIAAAEFSTLVFLTFSSGDTRNNAFLNTDGTPIPTSGVFTTSPISFKDATVKAAADAKAVADKAAADAKAAPPPVITKALITGGLVYHFDASIRLPTTSAWTDATTGGTTMTLHNTPTVTSGPVSYVRFNGTNQYGSSLNMAGRSAFSTTVWIRTTSTVDNGAYYMRPCVIGRDAAGLQDFELTIGAGYASIWTGLGPGSDQQNDSKTTSNYVADGAWHELTVTSSYAAGTILYVDGVAYGAALAASQVTQPGQTWFVAATNSDYGTAPRCFCAVDISIIALYDRSLSPTEVSTNFTAKRGAFGR